MGAVFLLKFNIRHTYFFVAKDVVDILSAHFCHGKFLRVENGETFKTQDRVILLFVNDKSFG